MAISKQVSNSGAMGGAGVQQIDVKAEIRKELKKQQDELLDDYDKKACGCPRCGEIFQLSPNNTKYQGHILEILFKKEGCPFCKLDHEGMQNLGYFVENRYKLIEYKFEVYDNHYEVTHILNVLRKPKGYRKAVFFKEEVEIAS